MEIINNMADVKKKKKDAEESEVKVEESSLVDQGGYDVSPNDSAVSASDVMQGSDGVASEAEQSDVKAVKSRSKSKGVVFAAGIAHIKASFNNTMVAITDMKGGVISWSSSGKAGFKGSRKSTAFAATMVGQDAARQAVAKGMREVEVRVQGAGSGRESAVRALQSSGLNISVIKDVTPVPHNGCRSRKRRRV